MLKALLAKHNIKTADLAGAIIQRGGHRQGQAFSRPAISALINRGEFPRSTSEADVKKQVEIFLKGRGVSPVELKDLWTADATADHGETPQDEDAMLPPKHTLTPQAMKHFKLRRSPFGDVETNAEMHLGEDHRRIREKILSTMRTGGFLAVVGESGSGKTTLYEDCEQYLIDNALPVKLIKPPVIGRGERSALGSPTRARGLLRLILRTVSPTAKIPGDLYDLQEAVMNALTSRYQEGQRFCLYADNSHRISDLTVMRDFYDLKVGRSRLLGIVLFGQLRLGDRLDSHDPEQYHITQHCDVEYLPPLGADLGAYLERRFQAVGADLGSVLAPDALDALRSRLTAMKRDSGRKQVAINIAYPLALNNLLVSAMNVAEREKARLVDAAVIGEA